jgi:hypothetical protein
MLLILIIYGYSEFKEANLILEELPAVTEPFALKVGPSFFNFTGSNCTQDTKESCQI